MRRFVYSPKVWAYVKTGNDNSSIIDISTYLVAGQVNRRLNAVSSAQLTIRNPNRKWTRSAGNPIFRPMDPITIYMMRAPGQPVQVFTGYLDRTPYFQLYPGTVTLRASCTLKRLLHTYFDPALPFTQQFLMQYGWVPAKDGMMVNVPAELPTLESTGYFNDSGIGSLLFASLNHIGGWKTGDIFVEKLPTGLEERITKMYKQLSDDSDAVGKDFQTFLKKYIGVSSYGSGGAGGSSGDVMTGTITGERKIVRKMMEIADQHNVPAEMVIATWLIEWPGMKDSPGNPHYGWFQWDTKTGPPGSYQGWGYTTKGPADACYDLGFATTGYCKAAAGCASQIPSVRNNTLEWTMKIQGVNGSNNPLYPQEWSNKIRTAKAMMSRYSSGTDDDPSDTSASASASNAADAGATKVDAGGGSGGGDYVYPLEKKATLGGSPREHEASGRGKPPWENSGWDLMTPVGTKALACADGTITKVYLGTGALTAGWQIHLAASNGKNFFYNLHGGSTAVVKAGQSVTKGTILGTTGDTNGPHLHFSAEDDQYPMLDLPAGAGTDGGGGSTTGTAGSTGGATSTNPMAAAFTMQSVFPSAMDMAESLMMQGQKSLMNDKPLLPFVEQLSTASLRQFQSLPDGRFFAFFPDYFGEYGGKQADPYWDIRDIEILDGNIELNDDELVTHQFVVGDTIPFGGITVYERLLSSGVVTIFNALNSGDTKDEKNVDKKKGTGNPAGEGEQSPTAGHVQAINFLKRYGARPAYHEAPMIRSPYFELFLAWQKFMLAWSKQFSTEFTFTFMPELYPGGKVGFPDHGIKMFIEEVTHSFDYTGGFTTTATLSAPSGYGEGNQMLTSGLTGNLI